MYEPIDSSAAPRPATELASGAMTLRDVADRLFEIGRIHSEGRIPRKAGLVSRVHDPELRAIAVALKLDGLLRDIQGAIHRAGESRS
jgi:hypothetical protein